MLVSRVQTWNAIRRLFGVYSLQTGPIGSIQSETSATIGMTNASTLGEKSQIRSRYFEASASFMTSAAATAEIRLHENRSRVRFPQAAPISGSVQRGPSRWARRDPGPSRFHVSPASRCLAGGLVPLDPALVKGARPTTRRATLTKARRRVCAECVGSPSKEVRWASSRTIRR
jgi:hypothetical protein